MEDRWYRLAAGEQAGAAPVRCPVCGQNLVGKVGTNQFFCWNCFVEFHRLRDSYRVFAIDQDGVLKAVADPGDPGLQMTGE